MTSELIDGEIFFSIIIPVYNRAHLIHKTLQSAIYQNYGHFEILIIDDASTDNLSEVVVSFNSSRVRYIRNSVNLERSSSRNIGVKHARGSYVYFLDSDDLLFPNHLSEANVYIKKFGFPEFIIPKHKTVDTLKHTEIYRNIYKGDLNKKLIFGNFIGCMFFLRRDIAHAYPFNEDLILSSGSEDYELCLRLASRFKIYLIPEYTCSFVNHKERSVLNNRTEMLVGRIEKLEYFLFRDEIFRNVYRKYLSYFHSDNMSYIALHLSFNGHSKKEAISYLCKSFLAHPLRLLTTKRFYVICFKLFTL